MSYKRKACSIALILLLLSLGAARLFSQQTEQTQSGPTEELIPEEAQQERWTKAFQEAEKVFNSENQSSSIPLFQDLIAQITAERVKRQLTDAERLVLLKSLDYLGQAFFLEEQQDQAHEVFLKLAEIEPNYKLNEDLVSPKIIDFVNKIKNENLGALSITSVPPGATVKIDGNPAGTTNIATLYSLKGPHDLEISKPGFFPRKESITITAGKSQKLSYQLERSSSVAYFVTYPKGIELLMNGKSLGVTGGEPSDRAQRAATDQNLNVADFSGEFPVPELQPGAYQIEFHKPCFETQIRRITIDKNDDFYFEPIVMVPSHASLNITADDPKANIFIDNDYIGLAPKQNLDVCSGKHIVKIKGPLGKFQKQVELKKDQSLSIDAKLNPAVAFLGITADGSPKKDLNAEALQELSALTTLNLQDSTDLGAESSVNEKIQQVLQSLRSNKPDKNRKAQIQELCTKTEADLLLLGVAQSNSAVQFYLLSNWSSMPDVRVVAKAEDWKKFKDELNTEQPLFEKRLGANLIDTSITPGPVIARVSLKTFDDSQPLNVGDVIVSMNAKPVKTAAEALASAQQLQAPPQITVSVQRSGAVLEIPVKMIRGPVEISFEDSNLLYNRQIATFKKAINLTLDPLEKNIATLNVGLCYMHFGEVEDALDQLRQVELDRTLGIGPGTVKYHIATCYRELGNTGEAQENLADALRYNQNTLNSDDGISVTVEAERARKALSPGAQ